MKTYENIKPVAVLGLCNFGGIAIYSINEDFVVSGFDFGNGVENVRETKIYTRLDGSSYFRRYGTIYNLSDFIRV